MGMYRNHLIDKAIDDTKPDRVAGYNPNLNIERICSLDQKREFVGGCCLYVTPRSKKFT